MKKVSEIFDEILRLKNKPNCSINDKLKIQKLQQQLEEIGNCKIRLSK